MNFSGVDPLTFTMFIIETIVLIGLIVLSGISLFKNYKGKNKLTVTDLLKLQQDLTDYAEKVYQTVSAWSDLNPANFNSTVEYREFLVKRIVDDFDELIKTDPDCPINNSVYEKLTYEDKIKLADLIANKIPNISNESYDDIDEETDENDSDDEDSSYVDIGDHLI